MASNPKETQVDIGLTAELIDSGILAPAAGNYIACQLTSKSSRVVHLEVLEAKPHLDTRSSYVVKARKHTFGRRGGWTVHDAKLYWVDRYSVVHLDERHFEVLGHAAYLKMQAYHQRKAVQRPAEERLTLYRVRVQPQDTQGLMTVLRRASSTQEAMAACQAEGVWQQVLSATPQRP